MFPHNTASDWFTDHDQQRLTPLIHAGVFGFTTLVCFHTLPPNVTKAALLPKHVHTLGPEQLHGASWLRESPNLFRQVRAPQVGSDPTCLTQLSVLTRPNLSLFFVWRHSRKLKMLLLNLWQRFNKEIISPPS